MKGLSKGRYDETFAGEDDSSYANSILPHIVQAITFEGLLNSTPTVVPL